MPISYFDSSLLLSILFNESHAEDALRIWNGCTIRVSSVLMKFETNISIRRRQRAYPNKFNSDWQTTKLTALDKFLKDVFFTSIDENLETSISRHYDELSRCKSLDAIHIAAAIKIGEKYERGQIQICSFDNNMRELATQLGFKVCGMR